jgi:hypothetical protein
MIYIETCRHLQYGSLYVYIYIYTHTYIYIYNVFVYELEKQLFDSYVHDMESYKFFTLLFKIEKDIMVYDDINNGRF